MARVAAADAAQGRWTPPLPQGPAGPPRGVPRRRVSDYIGLMCGRIHQIMTPDAIARHFGVSGSLPNAQARPNGAPTQSMQVIRWNRATGTRTLDMLRWGLIPSWVKDAKGGKVQPINAMCESVAEKAMFRGAFKARRKCLVPVTAFFEWKAIHGAKQPFAIAMEDRSPYVIAGLWENWRRPDTGEWVRTFTILTCPANSLVAKIHDRMPVILHERDYDTWLGAKAATDAELRALLKPYPPEPMTIWPVGKAMNSSRYQGDDTLDLVDDVEWD